MRHTTVPTVLLAGFMVSCATTGTFDTSRPLELESSGLGTVYRQGGQAVLLPDLEEKLAAHPAAGAELGGYQAKKWTGLLLGYTGGALVGWNVTENLMKSGESEKDWTLTLVGAGMAVASIPFAIMAEGQLRSAAEAYNGGFTPARSSTQVQAVPFIAVLPQAEGRKQCIAGVTMAF